MALGGAMKSASRTKKSRTEEGEEDDDAERNGQICE